MSTPKNTKNQVLIQAGWRARIGEWLRKNQGDIAVFFGFIAVALIGFAVGYFSAPGMQKMPLVIEEPEAFRASIGSAAGKQEQENAQPQNQSQIVSEKGLIVGSKSGTKYHWPWCSFAKNIKESNQVWFNSEQEAQAAGYSKCGNFDKLVPAGYQPQ